MPTFKFIRMRVHRSVWWLCCFCCLLITGHCIPASDVVAMSRNGGRLWFVYVIAIVRLHTKITVFVARSCTIMHYLETKTMIAHFTNRIFTQHFYVSPPIYSSFTPCRVKFTEKSMGMFWFIKIHSLFVVFFRNISCS